MYYNLDYSNELNIKAEFLRKRGYRQLGITPSSALDNKRVIDYKYNQLSFDTGVKDETVNELAFSLKL